MVQLSADPAELNRMALQALREGRFDDAVRDFREAVQADPKSPDLRRNLAAAERARGNDAGERAALDAAIDLNRLDFMAWLRKAELHQRLAEDGDAFAAWNNVLQMATQIDPMPEALVPVLDVGRNFVAECGRKIEQTVRDAVEERREGLDPVGRRRTEAFVEAALGRRRIYTNECSGVHYPFLPADEFFDEHHFPWFADVEAETDAIRSELLALLEDPGEALRPYVQMDKGSPDSKWTPLDGSLDWGACFLWEYGRPNQPVLDRCPRTAAALAAVPQSHIPGRAPSAFFSLLKPGKHIPPHTGVTNTRAIIHLPLIVPPDCGFRVGGETRPWVEGKAFAFDDTIEHEAWNRSSELRAVLIFDVWNPHLSEQECALIAGYFEAADAAGFNPQPQ